MFVTLHISSLALLCLGAAVGLNVLWAILVDA